MPAHTLCRINLWALWARAQGLAPQGASRLPCLALKVRGKKIKKEEKGSKKRKKNKTLKQPNKKPEIVHNLQPIFTDLILYF